MGNELTALGCHIYAGGFTLGVQDAGFKVLGHLEEGDFGVATVRQNLGLEVRVGVEAWHPETFRRKVAWLYGNPPCATWSEAGRKVRDKAVRNTNRWAQDNRTDCTTRLFGLLPQVEPKVFTWECVAAATTNGAAFIQARIAEVAALGYRTYLLVFNGRDAGLPQTRKRFFFVASKVLLAPFHPKDLAGVTRYTTPREAWAQLFKRDGTPKRPLSLPAKVPTGYADLLRRAQPGEPLHHTYEALYRQRGKEPPRNAHGGKAGRPGFMHQLVDLDRYAPTVTGSCHLYHPERLTGLAVEEMQLLCGYPPGYRFVGRLGLQYAQIAKAVLPPAARWLGAIVRAGLVAARRARPGVELHNFIEAGTGRRFAQVWPGAEGAA